jgi:hypothetical protein
MGAGAIPVHLDETLQKHAARSRTCSVFTAHSSYQGDDRIDVSFHGGHFMLTPPKQILLDFKLGRIDEVRFKQDVFDFLETSSMQHRYTWDEMLARERIVLVCSCNGAGTSCHRHFIMLFLKQHGAVCKGVLRT